jgi:hypothetical protein
MYTGTGTLQTLSDRYRCRPTQARYFFLPEVTDLAMTYDAEALEQMPSLPPFKNLYSLDLRNIGGNLSMLWHDVAEVLIGSPNLKLLGLELNEDCRSHHQDFLVGLVEHFKYLREANKTPKTRLKIQELILGRGIAAFPYGAVISGHLSELTDLSMLRSLKILNQRSPPMFNRPRVLLNHNLFLQATKLRSLSVYVIGRDIVALINALSCYGFLQEIQIRSITDYNNPNVDWYRPIDLGGGWKKILLGGDMWDVCPEHVYNDFFKTFFPQSCDIQELGLPYIRWVTSRLQFMSSPLIQNPGLG